MHFLSDDDLRSPESRHGVCAGRTTSETERANETQRSERLRAEGCVCARCGDWLMKIRWTSEV